MFSSIGWSELFLIAAVAIIVVGPKDLPKMLRSIGKITGGMRRMAGDFQRQFDDAIREAELDEVKDLATKKTFAPLEDIKKSAEKYQQEMRDEIEGKSQGQSSASALVDEAESLPDPKPASAKKTKKTSRQAKKSTSTKTASARNLRSKPPSTAERTSQKDTSTKKPSKSSRKSLGKSSGSKPASKNKAGKRQ